MVAAINHSYDSHYSKMPDGREFNFIGHKSDGIEGYSEYDREQLTKGLMLWSADQIFILDQLTQLKLNSPSIFYASLDTDNVLSLGHSFGGTTTYLSAWCDPRIIAAIDMDGSIWNSYDKYIDVPFLFFQAAQTYDLAIFDNVAADGYHIYLEAPLHHGSFFDIALFWG